MVHEEVWWYLKFDFHEKNRVQDLTKVHAEFTCLFIVCCLQESRSEILKECGKVPAFSVASGYPTLQENTELVHGEELLEIQYNAWTREEHLLL